jgi:RNA-directed DNA polymerase
MRKSLLFRELNWEFINKEVFNLQRAIAVAYMKGELIEVTRLQHDLVSSFEARAAAVRRVVTNSGAKTPGIDGAIWKTDAQKIDAIHRLKKLVPIPGSTGKADLYTKSEWK